MNVFPLLRTRLTTALAGVALAAFANVAAANACASADLTFNLDTGNQAVSGFTGPYVEVCIDITSATTANIEFSSLTNGGYIFLMSDGGSAALNINASLFSVGTVTGSQTGQTGFDPPVLTVENPPGTSNVNGFGTFNLVIDNGNGFPEAVNDISFTVTNLSGTWALNGSNILIANANDAVAASHIFVTTSPANQSNGAVNTGYAAGNGGGGGPPPQEIPEPAILSLLGIGLLGLSLVGLRRRRL